MSVVPYLSASSIGTYKQCPKRFYYEKIEKKPMPPAGVEAVIGTFSHSVLENFMSLPNADRGRNELKIIVRSEWDSFIKSEDYKTIGISDLEFKGKVALSINGYLSMEDPTLVDVVSCEQKIDMTVDGVPIVGFIDRISNVRGWRVCSDYKTGKVPDRKYEDSKLEQLYLYAAALQEMGDDVDEVELLYVAYRKKISRVIDQSSIDSVKRVLSDVWNEVNDGFNDFPCKPSPLCNWCPFVADCPQGKVAATNYLKWKKS